jgi:uncharacterized protein (DUF433 family)
MNRQQLINTYITSDPEILLGKPIIRGTRIPVYLIVGFAETGLTPAEIVDDYPDLTLEEVEAAIAYGEFLKERTEIRPRRVG